MCLDASGPRNFNHSRLNNCTDDHGADSQPNLRLNGRVPRDQMPVFYQQSGTDNRREISLSFD